jgi:hypothetical protein
MYNKSKMSRSDLEQVVMNTGRNESRVVLYSLNGYPCNTPIPNEQLIDWIVKDNIGIRF